MAAAQSIPIPQRNSQQQNNSQSPQRTDDDGEPPTMILQVLRYFMFQVSCLYFWLLVFVLLQLLLTLEMIRGTIVLSAPLFGIVVSQHLLSFVLKPEHLKHQQNLPRVLSWAIRVLDLVLATFFVLGHVDDLENIKSLTFIFLGVGIVMIFISAFFEFFNHFDNRGPSKKTKSLVHFVSTVYKFFVHLQAIVLTSKLIKIERPQKYLAIKSDASPYVVSIPIFLSFGFTTIGIAILCHRIAILKNIFAQSKRSVLMGALLAVILGQVAIYICSFSEMGKGDYFGRDRQIIVISLVCDAAVLSVCISGIVVVMKLMGKNGILPDSRVVVGAPTNAHSRVDSHVAMTSAGRADTNQDAQRVGLFTQGRLNELNRNPSRLINNQLPSINPDLPPIPERGDLENLFSFGQLAEHITKTKMTSTEVKDEESDAESVNFVTKQGSDLFVAITQNDLKHMIHYIPVNDLGKTTTDSPSKRMTVIKVSNLSEIDIEKKREATKQLFERKSKLLLPRLESIERDFDIDVISPKKIIANREVLSTEPALDHAKKLEITLNMLDLLNKKQKTVADRSVCQLCCEKIADVVFQPCGHSGVCFSCFLVLVELGDIHCFYCRAQIAKIFKIDPSKTYKDIFRVIDCYKIESH